MSPCSLRREKVKQACLCNIYQTKVKLVTTDNMSKRKEQRLEKNFRKQQGARKGVSKRRDKSTVS